MGKTSFTDDQKKVIDTRDKNILVSAAAGSGKTTVLVERIIRKIMGETSGPDGTIVKDEARGPVDIDRILVLTFTNAAAAEMRERIVKAIDDKLKTNKNDRNLAKQSVLIHNAQITTIHSFCLFLLRNHFADVGIDPAFRVASEGEIKLVEGTVAEELIAELFETGQIVNFELLAERLMAKNSLEKFKKVILDAYSESRNAPYISEYFEDRREDYSCSSVEELDNTPWIIYINDLLDSYIDEAIEKTKLNIEDFEFYGSDTGYITTFRDDLVKLQGLKACKGYRSRYEYIKSAGMFIDLGRAGMSAIDKEVKAAAKKVRDSVKNTFKDKSGLFEKYFFLSPEDIVESLKQNNVIVNALIDVVELYSERLKQEKNKRKIIDFGDMEHYALSILVKRENRVNEPTQVAKDYAEHFEEIMVDEYQDSNRIQEEILESISAKINSRFNRFMVGDVKQSIYSFRKACPDIFINKYDTYVTEPEGCKRIDLSTNFRSRKEVLDCVNGIFGRVMSKDLGMVGYDDAASLHLGADYPDSGCDNKSELLILEYDKDNSLSKVEQEASLIAEKVTELVNGGFKVYDRETDELRPCRYGDIVILIRSFKDWEEPLKNVLESNDIPTYIATKTGYFSALEVREIMNLLQVLDNPRQEIPLFGTMRGSFGGFLDDEIACIRNNCHGELIDMLREVANIDLERDFSGEYPLITRDIIAKTRTFLTFMDKWREKKVYTLIHMLIAQIIEETEYMYKIGSMPFGEQRKANVYMLIEKAKQYEAGSFKGLYHFVKYIEEIRSYDVDFGDAVVLDEKSDVVRIMTIHSSKGLEFPICFVSQMGKQYNDMFTKEDVVYDNDYGIALDNLDMELNVRHRDMRRAVIMSSKIKNMAAEEMRVLYVALTRAKEKLIMTGTATKLEKLFDDFVPEQYGKVLPYGVRYGTKSYLELVASAVGPDGNDSIDVKIVPFNEVVTKTIEKGVKREERKAVLLDNLKKTVSSSEELDAVKERIDYVYPYKNLEGLYTKTSVSELKIAAIEEKLVNHELEGIPAEFFTEHESSAYIPSFVAKEESVKGTARGSAYHRVMELFDFAGNVDFISLSDKEKAERIDSEFDRMISSERIKEEETSLVDRKKVAKFVESDLGHRMCLAAQRKELHLEEPFVLQIPASRLRSDYPDTEKVLIQGIIDAFFEEDGKIVLMDYKTDRVSSEDELIERYKVQLDYYKEALSRIRETEVKEVLIYSFALEKTILV